MGVEEKNNICQGLQCADWVALAGRGKIRGPGPWALPTATMVQVFDLGGRAPEVYECARATRAQAR
jgi:hypothetical protein